jgi:phenylacetate 2-hydroxylase
MVLSSKSGVFLPRRPRQCPRHSAINALVCRMGYKRVVIANSYQAVKELWIDNQSALISRPMLYTFHTVVSSSQGFTIGTSPWDESCKQRRKAAATALNRPAVASYMPIVDLESKCSIRDIYVDSQKGTKEINPKPYFQRFALNTVPSIRLPSDSGSRV